MKHSDSSHATDVFAFFLLDCFLLVSLGATCAYFLILFLRLPVFCWYGLFPLCLVLATVLRRRMGKIVIPRTLLRLPIGALLLLCLTAAAINAVTLRPNMDDYSYLHRALHAAEHLKEPISIHHTGHDIPDLPPISPMHLLSAVEVSTALATQPFGLPFIAMTHQGLGALALFLVPLAYYRLFRTLHLNCRSAIAGSLGALVFLVLIGGYWGHFTLTRVWQGKAVLIAVGLPLVAAATIRCMLRPQRLAYFDLHALTLVCVGLSSSAFFMIPYTSGLMAGTVCLVSKRRKRHVLRLLRVSTLLIPLVVLMALAASPLFPQITNVDIWRSAGHSIYTVIGKIIRTWQETLMYLFLAAFGFSFAEKRTPQRIFSIYAFLSTILLVIPGIGWILMQLTTPAVYWRLAFTSLAPALAGLPLAYFLGNPQKRPAALVSCCALWTFLLFFNGPHTLESRFLAPLHGEKFFPVSILDSDAIAARIPHDGTVIAPQEIAWVLGLRYPGLHLVVTRPAETGHVFKNYRDKEEAKRRANLSVYLERGADFSDPRPLLSPYLGKIDALVLPAKYPTGPIEQMLREDSAQWGSETIRGYWHLWYKKSP